MNPQDDPEARIRDLERPLSDIAHTSELGSGQATPWPYDTTHPAAKPTAGSRGWVFVVLALAVGALALAGIATYLMMSGGPTTTTPGRPTFSGGGGGHFTSTTAAPPATTVPETQAPTEAPVSTAPAGSTVSIAGVGANRTIDCNDGIVNVSGVNNTVVITGHCADLSVSGIDNSVTVDASDTIGVSGFDNRITYRSGTPRIANSGGGNTVEQG